MLRSPPTSSHETPASVSMNMLPVLAMRAPEKLPHQLAIRVSRR
jgi:hypothetical protein